MARLLICLVFLAIALLAIVNAQSSDEIMDVCRVAACGNDECRIYFVNLDLKAMCVPRPTMRFVF